MLVPVLSVLAIAVYANRNTGLTVVSSALLMAYAIGLISGVIVDLTNDDPGTWRVPIQAILLPIALTVGTLPYIQLLVLMERFRFSRGAKCKMVTSSDYGEDWPLTVDSARLCCRISAVWVEVNGKKYGVNGIAMPLLKKYGYVCPDLNEIWRDHPDKEKWVEASGTDGEALGWKVSIHRLIQDGLAL